MRVETPTPLRRTLLPALVFLGVLGIHLAWRALFPEVDPVQKEWADLVPIGARERIAVYVASQAYWMGIVYAAPLAFAVHAFRRYREERRRPARAATIGGLGLSGFLAVAGCFLLGCCGSPMLAVWGGLFGAAFLPFARPLMALLTLASIALAWIWMERKLRCAAEAAGEGCGCGPGEARCGEP